MSSEDDLNTLNDILNRWCCASKAKFNISKTEIIPIGMPGYRAWMQDSKKLHSTHEAPRNHMKINRDGEPVRILGAWVGNQINNAVPWVPVVEKVERALERWDKGHPSIEGSTQNYLTYFGPKHQSKHLAKHLRYFARYFSSKYLR
jgi:hypothetical protein